MLNREKAVEKILRNIGEAPDENGAIAALRAWFHDCPPVKDTPEHAIDPVLEGCGAAAVELGRKGWLSGVKYCLDLWTARRIAFEAPIFLGGLLVGYAGKKDASPSVVEGLVIMGADPNHQEKTRMARPLSAAIQAGNFDVAEALIDLGADHRKAPFFFMRRGARTGAANFDDPKEWLAAVRAEKAQGFWTNDEDLSAFAAGHARAGEGE